MYIHTSIYSLLLYGNGYEKGNTEKDLKISNYLRQLEERILSNKNILCIGKLEVEKFFSNIKINCLLVDLFGWSQSRRAVLLQKGWCRGSYGWCYGHSGAHGKSKMWRCKSGGKQGTAKFQPMWSHPEEGHGPHHCAGNTIEKA